MKVMAAKPRNPIASLLPVFKPKVVPDKRGKSRKVQKQIDAKHIREGEDE